MANVLREDIVQVKVEVDDNPIQGLVRELNELKQQINSIVGNSEDAIDDLVNSVRSVTEGMNDLTAAARRAGNSNVDGLRNSVGETTRETQRVQRSFTALIRQAGSLAKMKVTAAFEKMKALPRTVFNKVTGGIQKMRNGFIAIRNMNFRQLTTNLNQLAGRVLVRGWQGAKKLWSGLKQAASVGFEKLKAQVAALIPKMRQLAITATKAFGKSLVSAIKKAELRIAAFGKKAAMVTKSFGMVVAGLGVAAMKVGMDFDSSMSQVAATMGYSVTGLHDKTSQQYKDFEMLNKAAREQGKNTKFSAAEAGDALNYLALAGYDADKSVGALPTVLTLAQAGGMELADASNMATDAMSSLDIAATKKNLTNFGNQIAKTAQKSNTSVKELGAAIIQVGGTAKNLNGATNELKTAEMNTALGILADSGIKGAEGGTKLRNVIKSLTPTTDKAIKAFNDLHVSAYDGGEMRPLVDTFTDLNRELSTYSSEDRTKTLSAMFNSTDLKAVSAMMAATATNADQLKASFIDAEIPIDKLGVSMEDLIKGFDTNQEAVTYTKKVMKEFGVDAEQAGVMYSGLMALTSKDGNNRWQDLKNKILDSNGAMQDMADTMNDNLKGRLTELGSATSEVGIAIKDTMVEPAKDTVKQITGWMADLGTAIDANGFNGLVSGVRVFLSRIIRMLVNAAPQGMDVLMKLMRSVLTALENNKDKFADSGVKLLGSFVKGMANMIPRFFILGMEVLGKFLSGVSKNMPEMIKQGKKGISKFLEGIRQNVPDILHSAGVIMMALIDGLVDAAPDIMKTGILVVNNLLSGLTKNSGRIVNGAIALMSCLLQGFVSVLPNLMAAGVHLVGAVCTGIAQNLPAILAAGIQLIVGLAQSLISNIGVLIHGAITLVLALVQGVIGAIPMVAQAGLQLVAGLVSGFVDNLDLVIDGGIRLVQMLIVGVAENFPTITQTAYQMIVTLASGLLQAIPTVIAAVPRIIEAIAGTLWEYNWLEVGKNVIMGVVDGIKNGLSGLFGKGEEAAQETKNGYESGMSDFKMPEIDTSGFTIPKIDMSALQIPEVRTDGVTNSFAQMGEASVQMQTDVTGSVSTVTNSLAGLSSNTAFTDVAVQAQTGMRDMGASVQKGIGQMTNIFRKGMADVVQSVRSGMSAARSVITSTNLYSSGQNVVNGLIEGMASKKAQLITTAKEMADAVKTATNTALDIHSPSREMKKTGVNVVLGTKIGMESAMGELKQTSCDMGKNVKMEAEKKAAPQTRYTPASGSVYQSTADNRSAFTYAPTLTVKVEGSVDRQTEFRFRKIAKEVLKEDQERMKRMYTRVREV